LARSLQALGEIGAARDACRQVLKLQPTNEGATKLILELNAPPRPAPAMLGTWPIKHPPKAATIDPSHVLQQLAARQAAPSLGSKTKP
jgi:hypothetical protein